MSTATEALTQAVYQQNSLLEVLGDALQALASQHGQQDPQAIIQQMNRNRVIQVNTLCVDLVANWEHVDEGTRDWIRQRLGKTVKLLEAQHE